jgi:DNA-binding NtrC family response regulator
MRALFSTLEKAAATDATILIEGETGTGKEATAESIHQASRRRDGPFVVVDCGAIPANLLESELFGSERGAFTGAVASRPGAFETASGGTIFLDEIGELQLDLQPKILRALDRRQVKRVGSTAYRPADVRVIAATNRSLRTEVDAKRFRSDLYYRLAIVRIKLPALRERIDDLPLLVEHVVNIMGVGNAAETEALRTREFIERLCRYPWPGNIRQLRNYIERCVALGDAHLSPGLDTCPPPPMDPPSSATSPPPAGFEFDPAEPLRVARERWTYRCEHAYLEAVLRLHDNNVAAAARAAGVDRIYLYRLLWKHGLKSNRGSGPGSRSELAEPGDPGPLSRRELTDEADA